MAFFLKQKQKWFLQQEIMKINSLKIADLCAGILANQQLVRQRHLFNIIEHSIIQSALINELLCERPQAQ